QVLSNVAIRVPRERRPRVTRIRVAHRSRARPAQNRKTPTHLGLQTLVQVRSIRGRDLRRPNKVWRLRLLPTQLTPVMPGPSLRLTRRTQCFRNLALISAAPSLRLTAIPLMARDRSNK